MSSATGLHLIATMGDEASELKLSLEERLAAVRERMKQARDENLGALDEERHAPAPPRVRKRRRQTLPDSEQSGSEDEDALLRGINARAARLEGVENANPGVPSVYGGAVTETAEQRERLALDISETENKRKKYNRRRAFVADEVDMTYINEGNRTYNRVLSKHYDKYDNVRKIKESLEHGTALP